MVIHWKIAVFLTIINHSKIYEMLTKIRWNANEKPLTFALKTSMVIHWNSVGIPLGNCSILKTTILSKINRNVDQNTMESQWKPVDFCFQNVNGNPLEFSWYSDGKVLYFRRQNSLQNSIKMLTKILQNVVEIRWRRKSDGFPSDFRNHYCKGLWLNL